MSRIATLAVLFGLVLPATATAQDPSRQRAAAVARHYLLLPESWSRGTNPEAPRQLAAFEEKLLGLETATTSLNPRLSPKGLRCVLALDNHVLESVSGLEAEALLPLTLFYLEVFIVHAKADQLWLANQANGRYKSVLTRYSRRSRPRAEAQQRHAQMQVTIAARLAGQGYLALIRMARDAALHAVSLTPRSFEALYWAAFLEEKLGRYEESLGLLTQLVKRHGDDPEIRLRRGVNQARQGRLRAARADFESVARGTGEDDWRILAYQELAQLDPTAGDPRAVAILDEALGVFPDDQGLRLLASFHGRPVEPFSDDAPASPRPRYENVREDLLADDEDWIVVVEDRLAGLSSILTELRRRIERGEMDANAFKPCGDVELR